jgi:hypothetical protein
MLFSDEGWRMQFGEAQTPLSRSEEVDVFVKERQAGLDNTVAFIQRRRPGTTTEQAEGELEENITRETDRIERMRRMMALSGEANGLAATAGNRPAESDTPGVTAPDSTAPGANRYSS